MAQPSRSTGNGFDFATMFSQSGEGNNPAPLPNSQPNFKMPERMYNCGECHELTAKTFLCGRCKNIRYCSQDCQRAHWGTHKLFCGKQHLCGDCDELGAKSLCGRCKDIMYCNQDCQKNHWEIHKVFCGKPGRTPITAASLRKADLNGEIPACAMSARVRRESDIELAGRAYLAESEAIGRSLSFEQKK